MAMTGHVFPEVAPFPRIENGIVGVTNSREASVASSLHGVKMKRRAAQGGEPPAKRVVNGLEFSRVASSSHVATYRYEPVNTWKDVLVFFTHANSALKELVQEALLSMQLKVSVALQIEMERTNPATGLQQRATQYFPSDPVIILNTDQIQERLNSPPIRMCSRR